MKLQLIDGKQKSEPVARVRVEMVDDTLIKVMINDYDVINIWGYDNKKSPYIYVYRSVVRSLGFNLEVV